MPTKKKTKKTEPKPLVVSTSFIAGDIQALRPKWSEARCEAWLDEHGRYLSERLSELGMEVIEDLLFAERE